MECYDMMKSGENLHLIESEYDINAHTYKQLFNQRNYPGTSQSIASERNPSNNFHEHNNEIETISKHSLS
jgi:hypothetical protein